MKTDHSPDGVLAKMRNWCAYQERSQQETRLKLYSFRLLPEVTEDIIASLITESYLNEERFAKAFAGGKFRIKSWGKNKIRMELRKHKIPETLITSALTIIEAQDYERTIQKLIEKKAESTKNKNPEQQFYAILNFMISRGFETDQVTAHLKELNKNIEI